MKETHQIGELLAKSPLYPARDPLHLSNQAPEVPEGIRDTFVNSSNMASEKSVMST